MFWNSVIHQWTIWLANKVNKKDEIDSELRVYISDILAVSTLNRKSSEHHRRLGEVKNSTFLTGYTVPYPIPHYYL